MKNIFELLESIGVTVPEDKKADFNAAFAENYRTIADYNKVVAKRDEYKSKAAEKPTTPPEDAEKLTNLAAQVTALQEQLADGERASKARAALSGKKFANAITEKALLQGVIDALKADPSKDPAEVLQSLTHDAEGKELPGVFVSEAERNQARFTKPKSVNSGSKAPMTKDEIMAIKDANARQAAIAENMDLFQKG